MKQYKIIIVENDEDEQVFMKESFEEVGLFTILAQLDEGEALFRWLENHPDNLPDLILSDLNMPGKNGHDILSEIRTIPPVAHIPVIITSTSSTKVIMDKCFEKGAADYIVKPDTFTEYVPFVKELYKRFENIGLKQ